MPLPSLQKTWQYNVNNQITARGTVLATSRAVLRAIKNGLKGFATRPWTVSYSCNGTTAGTAGDGVDRWAADTDLVWAVAAHSWIVLRQTGMNSTFEILIDLNNATASNITIEASSVGFTGGTTTARPTSTETVTVLSGTGWGPATVDASQRWNLWQSDDGECTRIALGHGGNFTFYCVFEKVNQPVTGWVNPYYAWAVYTNSGLVQTSFLSLTTAAGKMRHNSITGNVSYMIEGAGNNIITDTVIGNVANEIDSSWDMWPLGMASYTAGTRGRHGNVFDLWMISNARASSDMIPGDGSNQFAVFKPFILPWNGSAAPAFS